jgi:serine/threonine protein kinase
VPEPGAQADLYVAEGEDNQRYALKIYRGLTAPSAVTAQALAGLLGGRLLIPVRRSEWQGRAVEITRYCPEGNLAELIKQTGPLNKEKAVRLVSQVTEGLEQLHHAGIQHRDLKPTNILVRCREPLDLVLADFGLAAVADATAVTQPHGTIFYSAPETLTGMYSKASDYWALGIILIEALTGVSIAATLRCDALLPYRIVQGKVPIPQTIPKGWHRLLKGLLERDHYRRWQTAEVRLWLDRESQKIVPPAEKKARPLLLASLVLALALTIGAGLGLDQRVPGSVPILGNKVSEGQNSNPAVAVPVAPRSQPTNGALIAELQHDTRSNSAGLFTLIVTTGAALVWVLAGVFLLIGITHALNGIPHGTITILLGAALAAGAYFLPRLWA